MFKTLRMIQMAALFFILSGFAVTSFNANIADVLNKLNAESSLLVAEYSQQNNLLSDEANVLTKIIGAYNASTNISKMELSPSEIYSLWLHYGELYRKASLQLGFSASRSKRILINIKGHMNVLLKVNGKSI